MAVFLSFNCTKQSNNQCNNSKTELLISEILSKKYFITPTKTFYEKDSSLKYNYLYTENIIPSKQDYYVKMNYNFKDIKIDSLRLKVTNDPKAFFMDANQLHIDLVSVNLDTTQAKLKIYYSQYNNIALNWSDYIFMFDKTNCRWLVQDSVFNQY